MRQTLTIFAFVYLSFSCQPAQRSSEEQPLLPEDTFQPARLFNNGLPADGCDYRIALQVDTTWIEYAPDEKSRVLVEEFATKNLDFTSNYHGYKEIQVKGHPTKKKRSLSCGWGATQQMPEITLSELKE